MSFGATVLFTGVVASASAVVVVVTGSTCLTRDGDFNGVFFFLPFTWFHPSSLLGWTPVSGFGYSSGVFVVVVVVVVVVMAFVVSVVAVAVVLVTAMVVF